MTAVAPRRVPADRRRSRRRRSLRLTLEGWAFVGPATVIVLGLSIFPAAWSFLISLQRWDGFQPPENVGFHNYAYAAGRFGPPKRRIRAA